MKNTILFLVLLALLPLVPLASAQGTNEVTVFCCDAGKPVAGAEVQLGTKFLNTTDSTGTVVFPHVPGGRYTLKAYVQGVLRYEKDVSIYTDTTLTINLAEQKSAEQNWMLIIPIAAFAVAASLAVKAHKRRRRG
ncbi:MAG: carboxypeptidase-like regulatory domain-containing protein [Candidatus Bathyarchaeota archaeon]|nr:carboxypeptidase-like regulatory domain-containing protein [Candidatus Bathyarchaeota archaeon]